MVSLDRRTMLALLGSAGLVPLLGTSSCTPPLPPATCGLTDFSRLITDALRAELEDRADGQEMTAAEATTWRAGVNCFSSEMIGPAGGLMPYLAGLQDGPPGVLRWTVEWDRYEASQAARQDWAAYRSTFDYCAANEVRLIFAIWVKSPLWLGDAPPGCSWAKASPSANYPGDTRASYGQFLKDLYRSARARYEAIGADPRLVCIEAWNEPDIRWSVGGGKLNYTAPWSTSPTDWAYFSGGTTGFADLHRVLDSPWTDDPPSSAAPAYPDAVWHSGGIGSTSGIQLTAPPVHWSDDPCSVDLARDSAGNPVAPATGTTISPWITSAVADNRISEIDVHFYMSNWAAYPPGSSDPTGRAEHLIFGVERCLWVWDSAAAALGLPQDDPRRQLPFYVGETGRASSGNLGHVTPDVARELRVAHWYFATSPHLSSRYRGMAVLGSGCLESTHGWWHPGYADFGGES